MKNFISLVFMLIPLVGIAQPKVLEKTVNKNGVVSYMAFNNTKSFIPFSKAKQLLHDTLKLTSDNDLVFMYETKDKLGFTRQTYEQRYKNIKVADGRYSVHGRNGKIEYIIGEYKKVGNVITNPALTEKETLDRTLAYINAKIYSWQDSTEEARLKSMRNDPKATYYPKGELLICKDVLLSDSVYRLAYKFDISALEPFSHQWYYIDAITGKLLAKINLVFNDNINALGTSLYYGPINFLTSPLGNYYILNEARGSYHVGIVTYSARYYRDTYHRAGYSNPTTAWPSDTAIDVQWGMEKVYDYWLTRGRNSFNGLGIPIYGYVHYRRNWEEAQDNYNELYFGDGGTHYKPFVCIEVVAHEAGHGINDYTAKLGMQIDSRGENSCLNEGYSDIWGAVVKNYVFPNSKIWLAGDLLARDGTWYRSLSDPKSKQQPDTYNGTYWKKCVNCIPDSTNDWCYSHTNMSVLSHWFYLLSVGGTGKNDLNNNYTVYGLGINKAADIAWYAEDTLLKNIDNAQYSHVMTQTIRAATDIYGAKSLTVEQVKNAWYAVGLGTKPAQINITITGSTFVCSTGTKFTVNAIPAGFTLNWDHSSNITLQSKPSSTSAIFIPNASGTGWVQADFTSDTERVVSLPYPVYAGVPVLNYITDQNGNQISSNGIYCTYKIYGFNVNPNPNQTPYQWTYHWSLSPLLNNQLWPSAGLEWVELLTPGYYMFSVYGSNTCGSGTPVSTNLIGTPCGGSLTLSPNPASMTVTVTVSPAPVVSDSLSLNQSTVNSPVTSTNANKANSYTIRILSSFNTLVYSAKVKGNTFTIPISDIPDGVYIVQVTDGQNTYNKQLVIQH